MRKYFLLLVTLSLKIILIATNDVKLHIQRYEMTLKSKHFFYIWVATFKFFSNFRATFGCIVKQLLPDLLAQSIHA